LPDCSPATVSWNRILQIVWAIFRLECRQYVGPRFVFKRSANGGRERISRNAELRIHTDSFEHGRTNINQIAAAHHGFLEHLGTESHSGRGRALSAVLSVPAAEFDVTLVDLRKLGRVEAIAEAGEDSAVRLESTARDLEAAKTTLVHLQSLQHDRKGQLHEALEVEKEIAQADSAVREAMRQRDACFRQLYRRTSV
jgi:hypothetical protein